MVTSAPPAEEKAVVPALLSGFCDWMRTQRGTQEKTLSRYGIVIKDVLGGLGADPSGYSAALIRTFILSRTKGKNRRAVKEVVSVTRVFLRYLIAQGVCRTGMDDAVPTFAMWRLSALPRYLPATDVERVIAACNRDTAVGLRDRAAILLMARLGLRAGDILNMDLGDIDWQHASVRVSGKSRAEVKLPLTQEVGDAVVEYLRRGRPPVPGTHLFIGMQAPWGALRVSSVSAIVARAIARARSRDAVPRRARAASFRSHRDVTAGRHSSTGWGCTTPPVSSIQPRITPRSTYSVSGTSLFRGRRCSHAEPTGGFLS